MSETDTLQKNAMHGLVWAAVDRFSTIFIQFGVNLVLARLLMPADFGIIGMIWIFLGVSQVVIEGGFVSALIQKKEPTQTDFSTIFFSNIAVSSLLYLLLFVTAPLIAGFYRMPLLTDVLRVLGLWLIVYSINVVQTARLRKKLQLKTIAIANLSAIVGSGALAIFLAYHGLGVWSLIIQQISYGVVTTVLYLIITHWMPSLSFSVQSWKQLFGFGGYMLISTILQEIAYNLQGILIGRRFSATQMGYYTQANRLDMVTSRSLPQVINQVLFPVFSSVQTDLPRLRQMLILSTQLIAFITFPIMGALVVSADSVVTLLFGEKWLASGTFLQILCVGGFVTCLQIVTFHAVAAVGCSRQLFVWSIYKWIFLFVALIVGMEFGIYGIMWAITIGNYNIYIVNALQVQRHIGLSVWIQWKILLPISALAIIGMAAGFGCRYLLHMPTLLCGVLTVVFFLLGAIVTRSEALRQTLRILKNHLGKKNKPKKPYRSN
ncbi:MAG: lipopolysaccharide biosynthesis protein [Muribaculaceae bacterium]|nr:lipopolysaccharide biosynthesis protein [Muribaculaceae bacterium]